MEVSHGFVRCLLLAGFSVMSCLTFRSCESCLSSKCGWCSTSSVCSTNQKAFNSSTCEWADTYFLGAECSESQHLKIYIGVCGALAVLFLIWTIHRCRTSSSLRGIKASEGMEKVYEEKDLVDVAFRDVNLRAFYTHSCQTAVMYLFSAALAFYFIYGFITDILCLNSTAASGQHSLAIAYALTILVSLGLLCFDVYRARVVLRTEDISDCFTNNDAARFLRLQKPIFNFFTALSDDFSCSDKLAFFIFFAINDARRLLLVEVPQFILINIAVASVVVSPQGRCEKQTDDAFCFSDACLDCLQTHTADATHKNIQFLKIGVLLLSGARFLFSAICYPFLRAIIANKFSKNCSGPITRGSVRSYCTYLIDKRVTELLQETKGSVAPDFFAKASRKVPTARAKLPMAEIVMPSQLVSGGGGGGYPVHGAVHSGHQSHPPAAQVVYSHQPMYGPSAGAAYGAPPSYAASVLVASPTYSQPQMIHAVQPSG